MFAAVGTVGDGLTGWQTIRSMWPFVTHNELITELDGRKSDRDRQLALAQADTSNKLNDLSTKVDEIDKRSLRWRVQDYPSKISNAQTNLVTLQAALADPNLSPQLRINLGTQIEETKDQIEALKSAQRVDTCLLYHSC